MFGEENDVMRLAQSALTAIDGLWFLELENELGFEKTFEIDLAVWKKYGPVMMKRIRNMLSITDSSLDSFLRILAVMCEIDGTSFKIKEKTETEATLIITRCPWYENLKRAKRENVVRCDVVDKTIFPEWIRSFNPALALELSQSIPEGHDRCEWRIYRAD